MEHDKRHTIDRAIILPGKKNHNTETVTEAAPAASLCFERSCMLWQKIKGKDYRKGFH